jgi:hypothetical protein
MFDNKFLITLLGLIVAVVAVNNIKSKDEEDEIQEDFFMNPSMTWKVDRVAATPSGAKKGDFFSVPGTYQAMLNPRFSNVDYGANIRYNMPSQNNLASPCNPLGYASNPLTFASMVNSQQNQAATKENFTTKENYGCQSCGGGCGVAGCRKGGAPLGYNGGAPIIPGNGYANGNFNKVTEQVYSDKKAGGDTYAKRESMYCDGNNKQSLSSSLPVRDMTALNAAGDSVQPIVYDRYIYANRNSRLRGQGDYFRGDLPIMPCNTGWFQVSVQPNIDLNQGAMAVMGGVSNDTSKGLADLIYKTSGQAETAISGIDYSQHVNMSTMFGGDLSAGQGDVNVTAFP